MPLLYLMLIVFLGLLAYKAVVWILGLLLSLFVFLLQGVLVLGLVMVAIAALRAVAGCWLGPSRTGDPGATEGGPEQGTQGAQEPPPPSAAAVSDPWQVLGVRREASLAEIRTVYRQLAKVLHPDVAGPAVDPRRMDELNQAMERIEAVLRT